jgi:hypothetical protein
MIVVAVLADFDVRWEGFWFLVDVCLLGAELGAELDVVNIAWLVEDREDAFAFDGAVFGAYACCEKQSQYWSVSVIKSLPGSTLSDYFNRSDRGAD